MSANDAGLIAKRSRKRASPEEMAERYNRIYEIVRANQPTGIRFTYYTASTTALVEKRDTGYVKVQRAILDMRRTGRIPWSWIVDTNRWMRKPRTWGSVEELLEETAKTYRRALWQDVPARSLARRTGALSGETRLRCSNAGANPNPWRACCTR